MEDVNSGPPRGVILSRQCDFLSFLEIGDVISGYSIETNHKMKNILETDIVPYDRHRVRYMALLFLVPVSFNFQLKITICDSISSERKTCPKHTLCPYGA